MVAGEHTATLAVPSSVATAPFVRGVAWVVDAVYFRSELSHFGVRLRRVSVHARREL